ncbi:uncharacterized protein LOC130614674 isoform X2 [Hydractinia symbiolongicarpus]|uniref:uncharacterized protein LOC130614674 isoform X2 n=1 Tax=Hydractinia symbiolongicarpus TaxID=13093 RepID=UPI00254FB496|nr:uncharacterized protein LOC130614674 isoform X2 [Hydractinia symbiolongicarpus]
MSWIKIGISLLLLLIQSAATYITRLSCRYHGNFSVKKMDTYFPGKVDQTIVDISENDCLRCCVATNSCLFINYSNNSTCELLSSNVGAFEIKPGWTFRSTDYTVGRYRGAVCRTLQPCQLTEKCIDACNPLGYECVVLRNVARSKSTSASTVYDALHVGSQAVDGSYSWPGEPFSCFATAYTSNPWFLLDLQEAILFDFVRLYNRVDMGYYIRLKNLDFHIGENGDDPVSNQICLLNQDQSTLAIKDYSCEIGNLKGRYLFIILRGTEHLNFCELEVFVK